MALERFANTPTPSAPSTAWSILANPYTAGDPSITVASAASFPANPQFRIVIDNQIFLVTAVAGAVFSVSTTESSPDVNHVTGAGVFHVLTAAGLSNCPLAMTTGGDFPYLDASFNQARLAKGAAGTFVGYNATVPIVYSSNLLWDNTNFRLRVGANGGGFLGVGQGTPDYTGLQFQVRSNSTAVTDTSTQAPLAVLSGAGEFKLSLLHTTYSADVSNGFLFSQDTAGVGTLRAGDGTLATSNKGGHISIAPTERYIQLRPGSGAGLINIAAVNDPTNGADINSLMFYNVTRTDSVTNYGNWNFQGRVSDGSNEGISQFQVLWEMTWTNAGGFTQDLWGVWDSSVLAYALSVLKAQPQVLRVGVPTSGKHWTLEANGPINNADPTTRTVSTPLYSGSQTWNDGAVTFTGHKLNITSTASAAASLLQDLQVGSASKFSVRKDGLVTSADGFAGVYDLLSGRTITTDADGTVATSSIAATFTKNDGNTRTFPVVKIQPVLNFGASNTTTSVIGLQVGSTNTLTTGLDELHYGKFSITTAAPSNAVSAVTAERITSDTGGAVILQQKARGSVGSEAAVQSGDVIGNMQFRSYDAASSGQLFPSTLNAVVRAVATENQDTTHHGARLDFRTTPIASTTIATRMLINDTGVSIGTAVASRGTTNPTNALNIFDGTAPLGTLTNGITLYSTAGELRVMDSAGNATLLSPHSADGRWIHDEINYKGRRLRIDMEGLLKALNAHIGGSFIEEEAA